LAFASAISSCTLLTGSEGLITSTGVIRHKTLMGVRSLTGS
jgi:hypothetical protein